MFGVIKKGILFLFVFLFLISGVFGLNTVVFSPSALPLAFTSAFSGYSFLGSYSGSNSNVVLIPGTNFAYDKSTCTQNAFWLNLTNSTTHITGGSTQVNSKVNQKVQAIGYCYKDGNVLYNSPPGRGITISVYEFDSPSETQVNVSPSIPVVNGSVVYNYTPLDTYDNYVDGYTQGEFYFKFAGVSSGNGINQLLYVNALNQCSIKIDCNSTSSCSNGVCIFLPDTDKDGVPDKSDNCVGVSNLDQKNSDSDAYGDACDVCPKTTTQDQIDMDNDKIGDACDADIDGDKVVNNWDNCVGVSNSDQLNYDKDLYGNICDADVDGDGSLDISGCFDTDNGSPYVFGTLYSVGIRSDTCLSGPARINESYCQTITGRTNPASVLYICNCVNGACDQDIDGDGLGNAVDVDDDGDGVDDSKDNCVLVFNENQLDFDKNGRGDACDYSPKCTTTSDCGDPDKNKCIRDSAYSLTGVCKNCTGTYCSSCAADIDCAPDLSCIKGTCSTKECNTSVDCGNTTLYKCFRTGSNNGNCELCFSQPCNKCTTTSDCGPGEFCDGAGDIPLCHSDKDGDGYYDDDRDGNDLDNCPLTKNVDQIDIDNDGIGDACDPDIDGDKVVNNLDNCKGYSNLNQSDVDNDGIGDACDVGPYSDACYDSDRQTIGRSLYVNGITYTRINGTGPAISPNPESCPTTTKVREINCVGRTSIGLYGNNYDCVYGCVNGACDQDIDGDGSGNAADTDDDGDRISDSEDNCVLVFNVNQADADGDFIGDACDSNPVVSGCINDNPCTSFGQVCNVTSGRCYDPGGVDRRRSGGGNYPSTCGTYGLVSCQDRLSCNTPTPLSDTSELFCCSYCTASQGVNAQGGVFVTLEGCQDMDGDGVADIVEVTCDSGNAGDFVSCLTNPLNASEAELAGVEQPINVLGPCALDTSVKTPGIGASAIILAFVLLILFYLLMHKSKKKLNRKVLKKKH